MMKSKKHKEKENMEKVGENEKEEKQFVSLKPSFFFPKSSSMTLEEKNDVSYFGTYKIENTSK